MNTLPQPDFSDVAALVPEIDFPAPPASEDLIEDEFLGPCRDACGAAKHCYEVLFDALKTPYPSQAALLGELYEEVYGYSVRGHMSGGATMSTQHYADLQEAYQELRTFVLGLEKLEEDDRYTEEHPE